jgi:hypothetical protein
MWAAKEQVPVGGTLELLRAVGRIIEPARIGDSIAIGAPRPRGGAEHCPSCRRQVTDGRLLSARLDSDAGLDKDRASGADRTTGATRR